MPAMTTEQANEIEIPRWVPPELRGRYRFVAMESGEEKAAAWARAAKAEKSPVGDGKTFAWTDASVEQLRRLFDDGKSASAIAAALNCSRSAVLGKIRRLNLQRDEPPLPTRAPSSISRPKLERTQPSAPPPVRIQAAAVDESEPIAPAVVDAVEEAPEPGVHIIDLRQTHCRWIIAGEGERARYCGGTKPDIAKPYCAAHARMAYAPVKGRAAG